MRCRWLVATLLFAGACAAGRTERAAGPNTVAAGRSESDPPTGAGGGGADHEPEIVHTGKQLNLGYADARARYGKGARCSGGDAPETVIGPPDQRNEMQQGKDRLVTYGYRFREGTLLLRCRADRVEVQRTLK